jgi:hypothetical protein
MHNFLCDVKAKNGLVIVILKKWTNLVTFDQKNRKFLEFFPIVKLTKVAKFLEISIF